MINQIEVALYFYQSFLALNIFWILYINFNKRIKLQEIPHIPVLYSEILEAFKSINDGFIIDCTTGYAGHSSGLLKQNRDIKLICNDQDDEALEFSQKRLKEFENRVIFNKGNFETVISKFKEQNIKGILADIGVSSLQLD